MPRCYHDHVTNCMLYQIYKMFGMIKQVSHFLLIFKIFILKIVFSLVNNLNVIFVCDCFVTPCVYSVTDITVFSDVIQLAASVLPVVALYQIPDGTNVSQDLINFKILHYICKFFSHISFSMTWHPYALYMYNIL